MRKHEIEDAARELCDEWIASNREAGSREGEDARAARRAPFQLRTQRILDECRAKGAADKWEWQSLPDMSGDPESWGDKLMAVVMALPDD